MPIDPTTEEQGPLDIPEPPPARFFTGRLVLAVSVSVGLLWLLFRRLDVASLVPVLQYVRLGWFIVALGAFGLACVLAAWRWHLMLQLTDSAVSIPTSVRITFVGHCFNAILFGPLGGDVAKAACYARWYGKPLMTVLTACFLDRLVAGGGSVLLALATFGVGLQSVAALTAGQYFNPSLVWAIPVALGIALLLGTLFWRRSCHSQTVLGNALRTFTDGAKRFLLRPRLALLGMWLGFLVQLLLSSVLAFTLKSVSQAPLPWADMLWTFPVISIITAAPISISGVGVREGSALVLLGLFKVPAADAVVAAMLSFVVSMTWVLVGAILCWQEGRLFTPKRVPGRAAVPQGEDAGRFSPPRSSPERPTSPPVDIGPSLPGDESTSTRLI